MERQMTDHTQHDDDDGAGHRHIGDDAASWDARYAAVAVMWSGRPNEAVVAEASRLTPGRALDAGCGEGADAMWLAEVGWDVVAVDISEVAIHRAAMAASQRDLPVTWMPLDLTTDAPEPEMYELVSVPYLPIRRDAGTDPITRLFDAVAPGGVLLWIEHDHTEQSMVAARELGWDPSKYHGAVEVRALLPGGWTIELDEVRPVMREDAQQLSDVVLRVRRDS
jgi:SAM-dependent methyltransferase